jgi:F0F1-type ATP synthase membrane subunit b/b'
MKSFKEAKIDAEKSLENLKQVIKEIHDQLDKTFNQEIRKIKKRTRRTIRKKN